MIPLSVVTSHMRYLQNRIIIGKIPLMTKPKGQSYKTFYTLGQIYKRVLNIEIVVTPRSSMANEKNAILFWQNWVAHQLKNRPFCKIIINIHSIRMD